MNLAEYSISEIALKNKLILIWVNFSKLFMYGLLE